MPLYLYQTTHLKNTYQSTIYCYEFSWLSRNSI